MRLRAAFRDPKPDEACRLPATEGAAAGPDEQRGRGGETEGAGAGDDEDGDAGRERGGRRLTGPLPL